MVEASRIAESVHGVLDAEEAVLVRLLLDAIDEEPDDALEASLRVARCFAYAVTFVQAEARRVADPRVELARRLLQDAEVDYEGKPGGVMRSPERAIDRHEGHALLEIYDGFTGTSRWVLPPRGSR